MRARWKDWTARGGWPMAAGLLVVAAMLALNWIGVPVVDRAGLLLFDSYQRAAPRSYEDAPVRIVDIDDETIRRLGQWPWPRTEVAKLNEALANAGASAIAYDIVFSEPDRTSPARIAERMRASGGNAQLADTLAKLPDNDAVLAQSFATSPVVAGFFLVNDGDGKASPPKAGFAIAGSPPGEAVPLFPHAVEPLPALGQAAAGEGFVSLAADGDGIVREVPLVARTPDGLVPSLSLEALRVAQGAGSIIAKTSDGSGETRGAPGSMVSIKVGDFEVPTTEDGSLWMHFTAPGAGQRVVPAWKILTGELDAAQMEQEFGGRIVLVGTGAIGLRDLVSTPVADRDLGVMAHAQAIEQMVLGKFLVRPDWALGAERALILLLGIGIALALPRLGALYGALLGAAVIAAIMWASWLLFTREGYLFDPTWPVLAMAAVYLVQTVLVYYREERQRAYIHGAFDRYLSPEMVRRIVKDPGRLELGGEERDMTVMFCDIRGFSHISEGLSPRQLIAFLIAFLTPMCDVLLARKATLDKFIGDAILAFWNAPLDDPDQHENAARAALAMVARMEELNRLAPQVEGHDWPEEVKIGIGLNSGVCCVGNMGSAQRLSYSLIGDTVNVASRIEGLTKFYGVPIALGQSLAGQLKGFAVAELDLVQVVGREAPEGVYALLGDEKLAGDTAFAAFTTSHAAMLAAYRKQDWANAKGHLDLLAGDAPRYGLERLYALYAERIEALHASPPGPGWDGVYKATSK